MRHHRFPIGNRRVVAEVQCCRLHHRSLGSLVGVLERNRCDIPMSEVFAYLCSTQIYESAQISEILIATKQNNLVPFEKCQGADIICVCSLSVG